MNSVKTPIYNIQSNHVLGLLMERVHRDLQIAVSKQISQIDLFPVNTPFGIIQQQFMGDIRV